VSVHGSERERIDAEVKKMTAVKNREFLEQVGAILKRDFGGSEQNPESKDAIERFLELKGREHRENLKNDVIGLVETMIDFKVCSEVAGRCYIANVNRVLDSDNAVERSYTPMYSANRQRTSFCERVSNFLSGLRPLWS
jgi:hypothetical protein